MKTSVPEHPLHAAPIVELLEAKADATDAESDRDESQVAYARDFAGPLLQNRPLESGEDALAHADGIAAILRGMGAAPAMRAGAYLVYAADRLKRPEEAIAKAFGASYVGLVTHTRKLVAIERAAREAKVLHDQQAQQTERVRKMLLAFSNDLRVVLLRLASRLQTLRYFAASKKACPGLLAQESLQVFAPLANRLGIWQIKWELEDLSFRFLRPDAYKAIANQLDESRVEREQRVEAARQHLAAALSASGIVAQVAGRPKHLYSIWKKMQDKNVDFAHVFDVRALRVIVENLPDCYAALSRVHELYRPVLGEFDDYIARPKSNGYQSLHTVVLDDRGRPIEVQLRTRTMHEHAEFGVAAHWAYKEAGARGVAGISAGESFDLKVAEARKAVLRQLLAWERDFTEQISSDATSQAALFDQRIYVFTPQATVVELPAGATAIDFAYKLHTDLGHRCRGARVDGAMVTLSTALHNGQTVEIIAAKEGGPSRDWLNAELGYLQSARSRSKVRAWFNALALNDTIARGRDVIEKTLRREGRTAVKLEDLAAQAGFRSTNALFESVGKDEYSSRNVQHLLRPAEPTRSADEAVAQRHPRSGSLGPTAGVLVVGVESLLTSLARCCRPAPPDAIRGYVTRGRGVSIHRSDCGNLRQMSQRAPERVVAVDWGAARTTTAGQSTALYPVEVMIEVTDRPGLLREISEVFAKEKLVVGNLNVHALKSSRTGSGWITATVELADVGRLADVLGRLAQVAGVHSARRK